jgi:hypothetical protein
VNFIEFVVGPLYQKLLRICPELLDLGIQIVHNRAKWGDKMLEEMAQKVASYWRYKCRYWRYKKVASYCR